MPTTVRGGSAAGIRGTTETRFGTGAGGVARIRPAGGYDRRRSAMATPSFEIVGRDAERESIEALLGRPRPLTLVIEGAAGIGKTVLWSFAQRAAAACGDRVLAWRASSAERELAFGALMGLLDADLGTTLEA
jgi:hypothetical protein